MEDYWRKKFRQVTKSRRIHPFLEPLLTCQDEEIVGFLQTDPRLSSKNGKIGNIHDLLVMWSWENPICGFLNFQTVIFSKYEKLCFSSPFQMFKSTLTYLRAYYDPKLF